MLWCGREDLVEETSPRSYCTPSPATTNARAAATGGLGGFLRTHRSFHLDQDGGDDVLEPAPSPAAPGVQHPASHESWRSWWPGRPVRPTAAGRDASEAASG